MTKEEEGIKETAAMQITETQRSKQMNNLLAKQQLTRLSSPSKKPRELKPKPIDTIEKEKLDEM